MKREREEIISELQVKRAKYEKIEGEEDEIKSDIQRLKYELNSLVGINRFPSELMALILNRLKASDLFACERVCRRWNGFVREFVRHFGSGELIISELEERRPRKWKFPRKFCSPNNRIFRSDLQFENLESSFLIELRRLKIINNKVRPGESKYDRSILLNDLDFVNKLQNLEVLEMSSIEFESEATLTLPHLRCLAVSQLESKLKLATPELSSFEGKSLKQIEFVFKEKVTHLHLDKYHVACKELNNLQYLALKNDAFSKERTSSERESASNDNQLSDVDQLPSGEFLNDHLNLRELSIRPDFNRLDQSSYLSAKSSALRILEQKKSLKRDDFQLIFFGVQLENAEQLDAFKFRRYDHSLVKLHLLNYPALCVKELRWVKRMHLSELLECVSDGLVDDIPPDFFEKFDQVEEIVIPYDLTEEQIAILKKFKNLNSLIVRDGYNFNEVIEGLPDELPNIWSLQFEGSDNFELESLGFVFDFKKLGRLLTEARYDDTVYSLFGQYDVFEVTFEENGCNLKVIRRGKGCKLELWTGGRYSWHFHQEFNCMSEVHEEIERKFAD